MNVGSDHMGHEIVRGMGVAVIFGGLRFPIKNQATILFGLARKRLKNKPTG